jgi:hypothetical protein
MRLRCAEEHDLKAPREDYYIWMVPRQFLEIQVPKSPRRQQGRNVWAFLTEAVRAT